MNFECNLASNTSGVTFYRGEKIDKPCSKIGEIIGVSVRDLQMYCDDRGILTEIVRTDWTEFIDSFHSTLNKRETIQQVYIVQNHSEAIRAFHVHKNLIDLFCIVHGYGKFILIDNRKESKTFGNYTVINVSDRKLQLICVPTGVYHGWKGSAGCTLLSVANKLYMGKDRKEGLDEHRISWDFLGKKIWETQFK